jgi:hypothetical protein
MNETGVAIQLTWGETLPGRALSATQVEYLIPVTTLLISNQKREVEDGLQRCQHLASAPRAAPHVDDHHHASWVRRVLMP